MAVHKAEPLSVPPPRSELPAPGIGFLSSLRAKSKDLSIGTLTPACILIMSPSACAENKLGGCHVILAASLQMNALGETRVYSVPTRDRLASPRPFLPARPHGSAERPPIPMPKYRRRSASEAGREGRGERVLGIPISRCLSFPLRGSSVSASPKPPSLQGGQALALRWPALFRWGGRPNAGAQRGARAKIAFWRAQFHAGSEAVVLRGIEKPRLSGRRCDELWRLLVYIYLCAGACINITRPRQTTLVSCLMRVQSLTWYFLVEAMHVY